jgi:prepilin-type N-terminal cleavage/methylation domain-containing protein
MERQTPVHSDLVTTPGSHRRSGFTLVELLAVIMIIALLAGLVTPAVMRARNTARNAAIKAEIDLLHMAIMNYKNEYGAFPPCLSGVGAGTPAAKHILRNFPRCDVIATQVQTSVTPANALLGWLGGYTDQPTRPVAGEDLNNDNVIDPGEDLNGNNQLDKLARKRLFDWDQSRTDTRGLVYFPSGKKGSPYIYINSSSYPLLDSGTSVARGWPPQAPTPASSFTFNVGQDEVTISIGTYYPLHLPDPASASPLRTGTTPYFNADTFQILCAGQDEEFGTDDDVSNFWRGTRKDYLDSLK